MHCRDLQVCVIPEPSAVALIPDVVMINTTLLRNDSPAWRWDKGRGLGVRAAEAYDNTAYIINPETTEATEISVLRGNTAGLPFREVQTIWLLDDPLRGNVIISVGNYHTDIDAVAFSNKVSRLVLPSYRSLRSENVTYTWEELTLRNGPLLPALCSPVPLMTPRGTLRLVSGCEDGYKDVMLDLFTDDPGSDADKKTSESRDFELEKEFRIIRWPVIWRWMAPGYDDACRITGHELRASFEKQSGAGYETRIIRMFREMEVTQNDMLDSHWRRFALRVFRPLMELLARSQNQGEEWINALARQKAASLKAPRYCSTVALVNDMNQFVPPLPGQYSANIKINAIPITGSPITVTALATVEAPYFIWHETAAIAFTFINVLALTARQNYLRIPYGVKSGGNGPGPGLRLGITRSSDKQLPALFYGFCNTIMMSACLLAVNAILDETSARLILLLSWALRWMTCIGLLAPNLYTFSKKTRVLRDASEDTADAFALMAQILPRSEPQGTSDSIAEDALDVPADGEVLSMLSKPAFVNFDESQDWFVCDLLFCSTIQWAAIGLKASISGKMFAYDRRILPNLQLLVLEVISDLKIRSEKQSDLGQVLLRKLSCSFRGTTLKFVFPNSKSRDSFLQLFELSLDQLEHPPQGPV
ncbi:hypothetical protein DFJ77DRAFT_439932 [Powellomyces hirtus]|nr:hypothetical protein DFJ77DRAFT_439932 [Powellomyces hirtus]